VKSIRPVGRNQRVDCVAISRSARKNEVRRAAHSSAATPPFTSGRWFSRGCLSRSPTDPAMPAFSS